MPWLAQPFLKTWDGCITFLTQVYIFLKSEKITVDEKVSLRPLQFALVLDGTAVVTDTFSTQ